MSGLSRAVESLSLESKALANHLRVQVVRCFQLLEDRFFLIGCL